MEYSANSNEYPIKQKARVRYRINYNSVNGLYSLPKAPELIKIAHSVATDVFFNSATDYTPIEVDITTLSADYGQQIFFDVVNEKNMFFLDITLSGDCLTSTYDYIEYTPAPLSVLGVAYWVGTANVYFPGLPPGFSSTSSTVSFKGFIPSGYSFVNPGDYVQNTINFSQQSSGLETVIMLKNVYNTPTITIIYNYGGPFWSNTVYDVELSDTLLDTFLDVSVTFAPSYGTPTVIVNSVPQTPVISSFETAYPPDDSIRFGLYYSTARSGDGIDWGDPYITFWDIEISNSGVPIWGVTAHPNASLKSPAWDDTIGTLDAGAANCLERDIIL